MHIFSINYLQIFFVPYTLFLLLVIVIEKDKHLINITTVFGLMAGMEISIIILATCNSHEKPINNNQHITLLPHGVLGTFNFNLSCQRIIDGSSAISFLCLCE